MPDLLADIQDLEERLHSLIDGVAVPDTYSERMQQLLVEAIIEALAEYAELPNRDVIAELVEAVIDAV